MTHPLLRRAAAVAPILALAACASTPSPATPDELVLYGSGPLPGLQVHAAGYGDVDKTLAGDTASVGPVNPGVADSRVSVSVATQPDGRAALALRWQDAWHASLRLAADKPMDLRPYLPDGIVEFELNATDTARSGLVFAMGCGHDCGRKINYVLPARALQGKGWQRLSIPLRCFERDGNDFSAVTQPFVVDSSGSGEALVANVRILRHGAAQAKVSCIDYRVESVTPTPLDEVWSLDWWMPRHEKKLKELREMAAAGRSPQLVFIGDSITQGWEDAGKAAWERYFAKYNPFDLGYGGDRTENALWRLQHGELDGMKPKAVVLMIGTNNTGHRSEDPRTIAAGIKRLLQEVRSRQPQAKVLLLAVFPRDEQPTSRLRQINDRVNGLISGYADGQGVFFLNINESFTNPDGTLSREVMPDLLHLNDKSYATWARAIEPTLARLMQ